MTGVRLRRAAGAALATTLAATVAAAGVGLSRRDLTVSWVDAAPTTEDYHGDPVAVPRPGGRGSVAATLPQGMRPTKPPGQAGTELTGRALPTNQWWTSALTGPLTQPLWAFPLAVRVAAGGIEVSSADPVASADAVVTPFAPAFTVGGAVGGVTVTGYGAFHVVLRVALAAGGSVEVTLVQGSPLLYLRFRDAAPVLRVSGETGPVGGGPRLRLEVAGRPWEVLAPPGTAWRSTEDGLTATGTGDGRIAVARVPDGANGDEWTAATEGAATDPVIRTAAGMSYDATAGTVIQTLTAVRASGGPGVWALLPHQGSSDGRALGGGYRSARGDLSVVRATAVRAVVALPGLLSTVPALPLPVTARTAVVADLDRDLADADPGGGSYFGFKELARLATVAEVAKAVSAGPQRDAALARLRERLVDWLTYDGASDGRYFGYDRAWGGLVAVPAEFGSNDYNDHHFQYGYLVRAAAVLAEADRDFLDGYGATVDLVVREYSGSLSSRGAPGFPPFRVFNAYLGNSAAAGFAGFADGNNQESSSEAVAAWEAVVRWGLVRDDASLTTFGLTHYALEAATARRYWLGEGAARASGYAHRGAGIVWDAKLDFATWFDARPESIHGIQLLPLTFGSLYRSDPGQASARAADLAAAVGGQPRVWADLFAADLALADPAAARARLTPGMPREESTSRAVVRFFVETLAALGPPQPAVTADKPYGLAFGGRDTPSLVVVNPTARPQTVTFRRDGTVVGELTVQPGQSRVTAIGAGR